MAETKITTYTADRQTFDIFVDGKTGEFYAYTVKTPDGQYVDHASRVQDKTLKGLQAKLRKHAKQRSIAVPVTLLKEPSWRSSGEELEIEHGFLTGVHAGNDRLLYRNEAGETDTLGGHYDGQVCRRMTEEQVTEVRRVWKARCDAKNAWETLSEGLSVSGRMLIDEALGKVPEPVEEVTDGE